MNAPLTMVVVLTHVRIHLEVTIVLVVVDTKKVANFVKVSGKWAAYIYNNIMQGKKREGVELLQWHQHGHSVNFS